MLQTVPVSLSFCCHPEEMDPGDQPGGAGKEHRRQYSGPALTTSGSVPYFFLLKEGARNSPLATASALGNLFMLIIIDWLQQ